MKQVSFWDGLVEPCRISRSRNGCDLERKKAADKSRYPGVREKHLAWCRDYYQKNRNKIRKYTKAWNEVNRDKMRAWRREYAKKRAMDPEVQAKRKAWREAYQKANAERLAAKHRAYRLANRDVILARERARAVIDRDKRRDKELRKRYGISLARFNQVFDLQKRKCAICKTAEFGQKGPIPDHCHNGGHFRGILCHKCNCAIGMMRDSERITAAAVKYLAKEVIFHPESTTKRDYGHSGAITGHSVRTDV